MSQVDLLYRLQQIDDEVRQDKKRLAEVVRLQQGNRDLEEARSNAAKAESVLHEHRAEQTDLNLELGALNTKAKRSEERLYSGLIRNPKELEDLQHEIESLNRRRDVLEDELLEAMILVEEAEEEFETASRSLDSLEERWRVQLQELQEEQRQLVARIHELGRQRQDVLEHLTKQSHSIYDNTIRKVGLTAVVLLKQNRCQGCLVTVPANLVKSVDEGELVFCDSCGRVLCPV